MKLLLVLLILCQASVAATLEGTIRNAQKHPLAAVSVYLQREGASDSISTHTDQQGAYHFYNLAAGSYQLRAEFAGYSTNISQALNIQEQQVFDITMVPVPDKPAFFDEPQYTVAGVTDNTYRGGHGADTVLRSSESLTKAAASLGSSVKPPARESEDSLRTLRQAADRDNKNAAVFHLLGKANENAGKSLDAVHAYQRAAELDPSEENLFDLGSELLTHLAPQAAVDTFTKGNLHFPKSTRMLLGLAVALYAQGNYDLAATRFFEACDLTPADPEPYLLLGKVERAEIKRSEGFSMRMHRFAQLQPENALANYYYALSLREQNNAISQVKAILNKAVSLNPNFAAAYLQLGILSSTEKDFPSAIAAYKKAIAIDPNTEEPHYRLSQLYKLQGKNELARQEIQLYQQVSKQNERDLERQRGEVQRFVIDLRKQPQ